MVILLARNQVALAGILAGNVAMETVVVTQTGNEGLAAFLVKNVVALAGIVVALVAAGNNVEMADVLE